MKPSHIRTPLNTASRTSCVARPMMQRARALFPQAGRAAALLTVLLPVAAQAQTNPNKFQPTVVGQTSQSQTVTVPVLLPGLTVTSVQVVTKGDTVTAGTTPAPLDFRAASPGCTSTSILSAVLSCNVAVTFAPTAPGIRSGAVVLYNGSTVIGTGYIYGVGVGGLGVMTPGTMTTYAGNGSWTSLYDGQPATSADLDLPEGIAFDGQGNMYIADSAHNRVREVSAVSPYTITTIAGNGEADYAGDGGPAVNAELNVPTSVAVDGAGNIYIADSGNNRVRVVSAATGIITTIAGTGVAGFGGDGLLPTLASLNNPVGVTVDPAGNIFIADQNNQRIREIANSLLGTPVITTVAGNGALGQNGAGTYSGDGGLATQAGLNKPFAVAFDSNGNMYIPDAGNNVVRMVSTSGVISTFAGNASAGPGYAGDGGPATQAQLYSPSGVAVDVVNDVIISDTQNNRIREVNPQTGDINTIAGNGVGKYDFDGQSALIAGIYGPYGVAVDPNGDLFIADYFDHRVREIPSNLAVLTYTPAIRVDQTSPTQTQVLTNLGNAPLTLNSLAPDANAQIDPTQTTCSATSVLQEFGNCTIGAVFAPTVAGDPVVGNILMGTVGANGPLDVQESGQALARNATTVALVSSVNPSGYGEGVNFTATVTTGADTGSLSGYVTFYDGSTALGSPVQVNSSGVATFNTAALAVGAHTITASYGGDTLHTSSTSTIPVLQTVDEATQTTLVSSVNPAPLNTSVTLTAVVSATSGGVTPTGVVTFYDGSTVLGQITPNKGVATFTTSTLTAGNHNITAVYTNTGTVANPAYFLTSTSSTLTLDVQSASTTQIISATNPSVYGNAAVFTATVTGSGNVPAVGGSVTFLDGGTPIGTATVTNGVAILSIKTLAAGQHAITAAYQASATNSSSTSTALEQVVNKTTTQAVVTYNPDPAIGGKSVSLSAAVSVTSGAGTPTGSVSFTDGGTALGTTALSGSGVATINVNLATGPHTVVATYTGDANDSASVSASVAAPVIPATTAVKIGTSANPSLADNQLTITAVVSGNGGVPTGSATFSIDGSVLGTQVLDGTGTATYSVSTLVVGSHAISVTYSGDVNDAGSTSSTLNETVNPIPSTTTVGTATSSQSSTQGVVLVATVVGASGPEPTGTVTFLNGTTVLGTANVNASGAASLVPDVNTGTMSVVAEYSGDSVHSASNSAAITITSGGVGFNVTTNPPSLTMASSQNAVLTLTFQSTNGFADTIGLGCASLPSMMTCQFGSDNVKLAANGTATVQLTLDTNSPLQGGTQVSMNRPGGMEKELAGVLLPVSALFGLLLWRGRKRHPGIFAALLVVAFSGMAMGMTGCAGISMNSLAPGTYTVQITGTGQNSAVTRSVNLTVNVTK